jgi:uncharacterized protein involved in exopolysaccharide biosynthesis
MNPFLEDLSVSTDLENRITTLDTLLHSRHTLINVGYDLGKITDQSSNYEIEEFVNDLSASVTVRLIGKDLVKLVYRTEKNDNIIKVATTIRERFIEKLLAPELSAITASETFLTEQLALKNVELFNAEVKLAEFKKENSDSLPNLYTANTTRMAKLNMLIEQRKIMLSGAIAAKKTIRTRLAQVDPVMSEIEQNIVETKSELAILRSRYTDNYSKVQTALRKLAQLESERSIQSKSSYQMNDIDLNRLWEIATKMEDGDIDNTQNFLLVSQLKELQLADGKVEQIKEEISSISKQVEILKNSIVVTGDMERQLLELERDLAVKRELYSDLLARAEKAKITGALGEFEQPERIKIIDEPYKPSSPSNFTWPIFLIVGLAGGVALGLGLALFCEMTDTSIRSRNQAELITSVPVISRIPFINAQLGD